MLSNKMIKIFKTTNFKTENNQIKNQKFMIKLKFLIKNKIKTTKI